jgi:hypothetical protein
VSWRGRGQPKASGRYADAPATYTLLIGFPFRS